MTARGEGDRQPRKGRDSRGAIPPGVPVLSCPTAQPPGLPASAKNNPGCSRHPTRAEGFSLSHSDHALKYQVGSIYAPTRTFKNP